MLQKNKEPFTMIPNSIIDSLSLEELGVYILVKKHAGAQGESWVSNRTLAKKLKISHNTVAKVYKKLLSKKLVFLVGKKKVKTDSGIQSVNVYRCVQPDAPYSSRCVPRGAQGVSVETPNKIPINKIEISNEERIHKYKQIKESLYQKLST